MSNGNNFITQLFEFLDPRYQQKEQFAASALEVHRNMTFKAEKQLNTRYTVIAPNNNKLVKSKELLNIK